MLDAAILPLISDAVVLRPMRPEDAPAYARGTTDPGVREFAHLPEPEYTPESVLRIMTEQISPGLAGGSLAVLTIADPATDAFAGSFVIYDVTDDSAEVGFWLLPEQRGTGRGRAALQLATEFVRRSGITQLTARTVPSNAASQRTLVRAGFDPLDLTIGETPAGQETALQTFALSLTAPPASVLVTERLSLRLHRRSDKAPLQRIYAQPEVARFLLDEPWTPEDASRQLSLRLPKTGLDSPQHALALVIEHGGHVIGDVLLWLTDVERRVAEIGWVLDPAVSGRGYATEAVHAVLEHAFVHAGVHRVAAQLDARNLASARLAARAGMHQEAHLRQNWWSKGEWTDTIIYGALATDQSLRLER